MLGAMQTITPGPPALDPPALDPLTPASAGRSRPASGLPGSRRAAAPWQRCREAALRALDPWLPRACALCGATLTQRHAGLCRHCRLDLPGRTRLRCQRCGGGLGAAGPCPDCAETGFAFDATCVLADYAPPLDRLIGALKFRGQLAGGRALGLETARALRRWQADNAAAGGLPIGLLIAVPLSEARLRERGFNQSQAIATALGQRCEIALGQPLIRARATLAQSGLPLAERRTNLLDAFVLAAAFTPGARNPALPEHVALVDDVMTTGATLHAAARVLRLAGVRQITAVVAARTRRPDLPPSASQT